jgi:hypothetical protein
MTQDGTCYFDGTCQRHIVCLYLVYDESNYSLLHVTGDLILNK